MLPDREEMLEDMLSALSVAKFDVQVIIIGLAPIQTNLPARIGHVNGLSKDCNGIGTIKIEPY